MKSSSLVVYDFDVVDVNKRYRIYARFPTDMVSIKQECIIKIDLGPNENPFGSFMKLTMDIDCARRFWNNIHYRLGDYIVE